MQRGKAKAKEAKAKEAKDKEPKEQEKAKDKARDPRYASDADMQGTHSRTARYPRRTSSMDIAASAGNGDTNKHNASRDSKPLASMR